MVFHQECAREGQYISITLLRVYAKRKKKQVRSPISDASIFVRSQRLSYHNLCSIGFFVKFDFGFGVLSIRLFIHNTKYWIDEAETVFDEKSQHIERRERCEACFIIYCVAMCNHKMAELTYILDFF